MSYLGTPKTVFIGIVVLGCKTPSPSAPPLDAGLAATPVSSSTQAALSGPDPGMVGARRALKEKDFGLALALAKGAKERSTGAHVAEADTLLTEIEKAAAAEAKTEDLALQKVAPKVFELGALKGKVLRTAVGHEFFFNNFGTGNTTATAEKGNTLVSFDVDITTTNKSPLLPCFLLVSRKKDKIDAYVQSVLSFGFRRWDSYGTYLGNSEDQGNDFSMSDTVKFVMHAEVPLDVPRTEALYLFVERQPSARRVQKRFERPPVTYVSTCEISRHTTLAKLTEKYLLVDWRRPP